MSEYECECGERYTSAAALAYCPCTDYDHRGLPKYRRGEHWID